MTLMQTMAGILPEIVLVAILVIIVLFSLRTKSYIDVRLGDSTVHAELADNLVKQVLGLMGRTALADDEGMMFPLGEESRPKFWMMGMRMPIDVIYIGSDKTVVDVKSDVQPFSLSNPDTAFAPDQKAMYVLEVAAGFVRRHAISAGMKADFAAS